MSISERYTQIIKDAELADYGPVRGCLVIRPYGFSIWQQLKDLLDKKLQETGHQPAYFPLLIPEKFITDEMEYVEGLSPRVFTVTEAGGEKLDEPLVIRPTSETVISYMFAKWIDSYRDLPLRIYQWSNVVRWEYRTRPFIKETEILWLEGHTAHATHKESMEEVRIIVSIFVNYMKDFLAIPVIWGVEPQGRKFAGSLDTFTVESLMPDGNALQLASVYDLGQRFSKAFDVFYRDKDNEITLCWTTNWGLGFRLIGAIALVHGDERGLRLPPKIAPIQVVVLPIYTKDEEWQSKIDNFCDQLFHNLVKLGIRVQISKSDVDSISHRIRHWEVRGVPLCILIGKKEIDTQEIPVLRRDFTIGENKVSIPFHSIGDNVCDLLNQIQMSLYEQALTFQRESTSIAFDLESFAKNLNSGWVLAEWCESEKCEKTITMKFGSVIRCIIGEKHDIQKTGRCFYCGRKSKNITLFAKGF